VWLTGGSRLAVWRGHSLADGPRSLVPTSNNPADYGGTSPLNSRVVVCAWTGLRGFKCRVPEVPKPSLPVATQSSSSWVEFRRGEARENKPPPPSHPRAATRSFRRDRGPSPKCPDRACEICGQRRGSIAGNGSSESNNHAMSLFTADRSPIRATLGDC
jgi:hypothetical protein